jgi:hypothetical protein
MTYYTHHRILDALQYVRVDAPSGDSADGMTFYTYHRYVDDLHHVCVDSAYPEKKKITMINSIRKTKLDKKALKVSTISIQNYTSYQIHSYAKIAMVSCKCYSKDKHHIYI